MTDYSTFAALCPTAYADGLGRNQFMDMAVHPLWAPMPRIAGPAFTVQLVPGDNLMLHAAIYQAPPGSVVVVDAGDSNFAVAGGNVCAVAQKRGIVGFVIDGVIRDRNEVREHQFPVFARGVMPIPGGKKVVSPLNQPVTCGGVRVHPGDIVIADAEGIAVVPQAQQDAVYAAAKQRTEKDAATTLEAWEASHRRKIEALLRGESFPQN